jgi:hypothetical protein
MLRGSAQSERSFVSLRSPLPLLVAGVGVALLVIAVVTLPPRPATPDPTQFETLTQKEALTIVAETMRSGDSAVRVSTQGQARFDDGTWLVTVGEAQFHFTQRNRIVVPDNPQAEALKYQ